MILININNMMKIIGRELNEGEFICYARPAKSDYNVKGSVLVLSNSEINIFYVSPIRNKAIASRIIPIGEIDGIRTSKGLLQTKLSFTYLDRKYTFVILNKILSLGNIQMEFLEFLKTVAKYQ